MSAMSVGDCGVCIGGDSDGEYCDVSEHKIVKARKPHKCLECDRTIAAGDDYERIKQLYDGGWSTWEVCLICSEISIAFSCAGRIIGNIWEDIHDNLFPN